MREYVYETFYYGHTWVTRNNNKQRCRDVIDRFLRNGYRYVGYVPTEFGAYGMINAIDLIFEKDDRRTDS